MFALKADQAFSFFIILILFLGLAHPFAYIFEKYKQPRVIGEILVGILLGATGLYHIAPRLYDSLFNVGERVLGAVGGVQELGLIFLMFCSGFEINWLSKGKEIRQSFWLAFFGLVIPLAVAFLAVGFFDLEKMQGEIRDIGSMRIIFMLAVAVTSIPVISRILADLKLLGTHFARVVLSVGLIEDLFLYGILSALLAKHGLGGGHELGIKGSLGILKGTWLDFFYNFLVVLLLFGASIAWGPAIFRKIKNLRINLLFKGNQAGFILVFLFSIVLLGKFLGVASIFAAFLAGMIVGRDKEQLNSHLENIRNFSFSTFIPLYFVVVGFSLDLYSGMDWIQFIEFFVFSSLVKVLSIYVASLFYGQSQKMSLAYGFALNARGGPGIVLATICFNANLISKSFFGTLVLTALLTSLISGFYLRQNRNLFS